MNPVPVSDEMKALYPLLRRLVIAAPSGRLDGDGSSVEEAAALEALVGLEDGIPVFREFWKPSAEELADLNAGAELQLTIWTRQLPVHSMVVMNPPDGDSSGIEGGGAP